MSDEQIKAKAEKLVIDVLQFLNQYIIELTKDMTEEETQKFIQYYFAAGGKAMQIAEDEANIDYRTAIDCMMTVAAETY